MLGRNIRNRRFAEKATKKTIFPVTGPPLPHAPGKKYAVRANPSLRPPLRCQGTHNQPASRASSSAGSNPFRWIPHAPSRSAARYSHSTMTVEGYSIVCVQSRTRRSEGFVRTAYLFAGCARGRGSFTRKFHVFWFSLFFATKRLFLLLRPSDHNFPTIR